MEALKWADLPLCKALLSVNCGGLWIFIPSEKKVDACISIKHEFRSCSFSNSPESFTTSSSEAGSLFFGLVSVGKWEGRAGLLV